MPPWPLGVSFKFRENFRKNRKIDLKRDLKLLPGVVKHRTTSQNSILTGGSVIYDSQGPQGTPGPREFVVKFVVKIVVISSTMTWASFRWPNN